jgi:hypothetical protein
MVIKNVSLDIVCGITSKIPDTGRPEVAFAGKSNVGKSSLINGLMNRKALALGADAVLIGRPFVNMVYGGGAEGVQVYVDKLKAELADTMAMCGAHKLSDIKRSMLFGY